jgi:ubiquinone/menaquinone biosynthesis C-methylase UbiE
MQSLLLTPIAIILILVSLALVWRFSSHRANLPCPTWLGWLVEMDNPFLRNNSAREIIGHLGLKPGMKVLDFGCGPGRLSLPVAHIIGPNGVVTAFDLQEGMLERVRSKAEAENISNIQCLQGQGGQGKLTQNYYDRALLVTVLGEIPNQTAALAEILASLKPGGILSITEVIADPHFQWRENVTRVANSVGFAERAFFGSKIAYTIHFEKR